MKITQEELINRIEDNGYGVFVDQIGGELHIIGYLEYTGIPDKATELPGQLHIHDGLDVEDTKIKRLPDDIVILGNFYSCNNSMDRIESTFRVGKSLQITGSYDIVLESGIYIGYKLWSEGTKRYSTYDNVIISGYLVDLGFLS